MNTVAQKSAFIAAHRDLAKAILTVKTLNDEYIVTDAGNVIVDADFTDVNDGILNANMVSFQSAVVTPIIAILEGAGVETVVQNYKNV